MTRDVFGPRGFRRPLQADRLRRMMGDAVESAPKAPAHLSADDLNDGFILDKGDKETLTYKVSVVRPGR